MRLPSPSASFVWTDSPGGPALVCTPLADVARHTFTSRTWRLGQRGAAPEDGWAQVADAFGVDERHLLRLTQVHGAAVAEAGQGAHGDDPPQADIAVAAAGEWAVAVQSADCVPILLASRTTGAVAAAHAGWRGLVQRVPARAVEALCARAHTAPDDLVVAIGPSVGACCYEVGPDVRAAFLAAGHAADRWLLADRPTVAGNPCYPGCRPVARDGHAWFDGWRCVTDQLVDAGVHRANVHLSQLCTASHAEWLCSYRRDGVGAGRLAAVIAGRRVTR